MHDRKINDKLYVFGNAGGLYMNAMTWWDHQTQSIWSQPIGKALAGILKDVELALLPSQVTTWENWKESHPETLALTNNTDSLGFFRQGFNLDFVIGIVIAGKAKAYYYQDIENLVLLNDFMDEYSVLIWAAGNDFRAYLRDNNEMVLTFENTDHGVEDLETGSTWDIRNGLAVDGELKGQSLQQIPTLTSYDWAWEDFYPNGEIYSP